MLHLTEGKLSLWKSDLTPPLIWSLWTFVEKVKKTPETFVVKTVEANKTEDHLSDTGSWGTDFEDDINEETTLSEMQKRQSNHEDGKRQRVQGSAESKQKNDRRQEEEVEEETYANCISAPGDKNAYANCHESRIVGLKNVSRLHQPMAKSLAEQLKEQLQLRNAKKPMAVPKPASLQARKVEVVSRGSNQPQRSFLHDVSKARPNVLNQMQWKMNVPPPPEPKKNKDQPAIIEKVSKEQPKPPILRSFDLVANLPAPTEESEDDYEAFDEQIIEQNQKKNMLRVNSKQSLTSGHRSSAESVYQAPSVTSYEDSEEPYEIYESITETPNDTGYPVNPIQRPTNTEGPPRPPLPRKPPQSSASASPTSSRSSLEKERSPDKKSATLPHSNSNTSLSSERATRPLPLPPERQSYVDKPWFHNVTREQATALINEQSTYGNPQDGYFLLRPSTTNVNNPLALVLWYKDRVYNVAVRKRPDNRYALGLAKVNEQSFTNVEEIVMFYTREDLLLCSGDVIMGSTKLTDTPPK